MLEIHIFFTGKKLLVFCLNKCQMIKEKSILIGLRIQAKKKQPNQTNKRKRKVLRHYWNLERAKEYLFIPFFSSSFSFSSLHDLSIYFPYTVSGHSNIQTRNKWLVLDKIVNNNNSPSSNDMMSVCVCVCM